MKYLFYNIFINNNFETDKLKFRCIFDSEGITIPKNIDVPTHEVAIKNHEGMCGSLFFSDSRDTQLKDCSLLLTVFQGTHIFSKEQNVGRISNHRKDDFEFFLSNELGDFLNLSFSNLSKMSAERLEIVKTALFMFYEAKHLMFYGGLRDILMMNCFEYLMGAVYRQDENYFENDLKLQCSYNHIVGKFNYQKYIDDRLGKEIDQKSLKEFKKEQDIKSIARFINQFQRMRNWIAHGKQHAKPIFEGSHSNHENVFYYRLESFIRLILVDLIYGKDYARKFDVLYQLILENNVCPTFTPEFPRLKFYDSEQYILEKRNEK
jgi:hypothetical protein